jgi:hypothetical protein
MSNRVFISYSHKQGDWVWDRMVPCLKAGGANVLIDREQFEAARALNRQMDEVQDRADLNVLVFSPDYLTSKPCQREMKRAIPASTTVSPFQSSGRIATFPPPFAGPIPCMWI